MSVALMPSTWSAFSPVATPCALVVNGLASATVFPLGGVTSIEPPSRLFQRLEAEAATAAGVLRQQAELVPGARAAAVASGTAVALVQIGLLGGVGAAVAEDARDLCEGRASAGDHRVAVGGQRERRDEQSEDQRRYDKVLALSFRHSKSDHASRNTSRRRSCGLYTRLAAAVATSSS